MTTTKSTPKRLYRSETDRMLGGVAGGIGDYFDVDPTLIRLAFVAITLLGGSGIIAYLVLWVILPTAHQKSTNQDTLLKENTAEIKTKAESLASAARSANSRPIWGFALILIGLVLLLQNFGFIFHFNILRLWPLIPVAIGLSLLFKHES